MSTTTSLRQPALLGGMVMGVLSALPFVSIGNFCCCLWVVSGGVVAAYVLQQNEANPITPGDGALAGLLAGLVGAGVHFVLSIPIDLAMAPLERNITQSIIDMTGNVELRDVLERYSQTRTAGGAGLMILGKVFGLFFMAFVGAIFSTIGGLIGAMVFRKAEPLSYDIPPR